LARGTIDFELTAQVHQNVSFKETNTNKKW